MRSASAYRLYVTRYYQYVTYFQRFSCAAWTKGGVMSPPCPPLNPPLTSQKFGDKNSWDFANLLKVIEEVQARKHSSPQHEVSCRSRDLPTGAALIVETTPYQRCFCNHHQCTQDCQEVHRFKPHHEVLRKTGRCYVCLGRGHLS